MLTERPNTIESGREKYTCSKIQCEDFTFGKGRGGNVEVLREVGATRVIACATHARMWDEGRRAPAVHL